MMGPTLVAKRDYASVAGNREVEEIHKVSTCLHACQWGRGWLAVGTKSGIQGQSCESEFVTKSHPNPPVISYPRPPTLN